MSHFVVIVTGPYVDKQLRPYQENNMGDCPKKFLQYGVWNRKLQESKYFKTKREATAYLKSLPDEECFREDGVQLENPNRKWDWYQIGGRWHGFFKCKKGSSGLFGDPSWWHKDDGDINPKGRADILIKKDWDMEGQAKEEGGIIPFAVLHEGVWYEKGTMGWFASVKDEKAPKLWEKEVLKIYKSLDENTLLTAVDCHI